MMRRTLAACLVAACMAAACVPIGARVQNLYTGEPMK